MRRQGLFATAAVLAAASPALAQSPPVPSRAAPPAAAPARPAEVQGIVVQGAPPPVRTSIDRQSYSVANDLQATTGSIGDALRNVPSVEVDVQGNVSLRGDSNVTILIDGKPSGRFRGDGKALALQSLPADQIERVEVITNPSAAFSPEGSAGVINLITKKTARRGASGSVRANVGNSDRQNGGLSVSRKAGKLTLSSDLYLRHDGQRQVYGGDRVFAPTATTPGFTEQRRGVNDADIKVVGLRTGVDYDPDAKSRISAEVDYSSVSVRVDGGLGLVQTTDAGAIRTAYDNVTSVRQDQENLELRLSYRRKMGEDHEFNASVARERNDRDNAPNVLRTFRVPAAPTTYDDPEYTERGWRTQAKLDWSTPLPGKVKLKLGYELNADDNDYRLDYLRSLPPGPTSLDLTRSNLFRFDQQVHAVFATYERPLTKKLTALAGLRGELTRINLDQVTQGQKDDNDDVRLYPSLHLSYQLDEARRLTASYSRRVQRPPPQAYNAFRIYSDPQNLSQGNPDLKPQITDSFEAGFQSRRRGTILLATAYYRHGQDAVNSVVRDLGGGVILQTQANIGSFQSAGVEFVANGRLPKKISYNLSGNLLWSEIDAASLGFGSRQRSGFTPSGRGSLTWDATAKDTFQVQGFVNGKRLTPQGYARPSGALNLGYKHKFRSDVSGVITVQDTLATQKFKSVIQTGTYREVTFARPRARGVFAGFTYTFGAGRQRDPGFDFGGGGPPGD